MLSVTGISLMKTEHYVVYEHILVVLVFVVGWKHSNLELERFFSTEYTFVIVSLLNKKLNCSC